MDNMKWIYLYLFIYSLTEVFADKSCVDFESCSDCISFARIKCVWCTEQNKSKPRCQSESFMKNNPGWCKREYISNPEMSLVNTATPSSTKEKPVQFTPQKMVMKMRPGAQVDFNIYYQQVEHFPLDIYFLIDYSSSMESHVSKLRFQADNVFKSAAQFVNNVQYGIGSFVDKPDFPFADSKTQMSYSFKNHLSLTKDTNLFKKKLNVKPTGSNYDKPEASFDGLMQVMSCEKELGWRPDASRIIIVVSDSTYHSAGDGKTAGAAKPNDEKCYLTNDSYSLVQDYPSVSQINKMVVKGNFKIIFAMVRKVQNDYTKVIKQIFGAQLVILNQWNSKIDKIITDTYKKSIKYLTVKYKGPPYVQLLLNPDCTLDEKCEIKHREKLTIQATLKVNSCPQEADERDLTVGSITGGLEDMLNITLDVNCQCECEKPGVGVLNSPICSGFGTYECGVCKCNNDRSGDTCQCHGTMPEKAALEICKYNNDTSFCSGRGDCVCGKCSCNKGFSGDFCEYDDSSCHRRDNKLCSGHGKCTRGACDCDSTDWSGDDCGCNAHVDTCYAPYSKEICSGNGKCICGECVCLKLQGKNEVYSGVFCEDCEECAVKRCRDLEDYVICNHNYNKTHCDQLEEFKQASSTTVQMLNRSEINAAEWPAAKWCRKTLEGEKSIIFFHFYDKSNKKLELFIQNELEEVEKADIWVTAGIAIGTVLLIGLLTVLVWKILVDVMDQREYHKFEIEAKAAGYEVIRNPFFQPASSVFNNMAYNNTAS